MGSKSTSVRAGINRINQPQTGMQLFDAEGPRLHCTEEERCAFVAAVANAPREVRTFCGTLHATGCRISEALALTTGQTRVIFNPHRLTHSGTGY